MTKTMSVERTREHEIDGETDSTNVLATLSEEQENRVQIDKIRQFTVEPGLMRLPVSVVTKAKNSEKWVVELEHPIEGTHRFYIEAPLEGWSDENELVQVLDWYGIDNDPYQLQLKHMYVKKTGDEADQHHGWELTAPPDYDPEPPEPMRVQIQNKFIWLKEHRPSRSVGLFYTILTVGVVVGAIAPLSIPFIGRLGVSLIAYFAATVAGLVLLNPDTNE